MVHKIVIGSDALGYEMKQYLSGKLREVSVAVEDVGCNGLADARFYPEIAAAACERILHTTESAVRGILICGTGIGMTITANKFQGIYAAPCHDMYSCERSILSNRANVICFGAQIITKEFAWEMVQKWLTLEFLDGRSTPKLELLQSIEERNFAQ